LVLALIVLYPSFAQAQNWPRFRGPNGQGISQTKGIPTKWSQTDYAWKTDLRGTGHSSPIVWNNVVFVTSDDPASAGASTGTSEKAAVGIIQALNIVDGKELWHKQYELSAYKMNRDNSYATATPAVDDEHVYVLWPTANQTIIAALDHSGNEIWKRTFQGTSNQHGPGSSPVVCDDPSTQLRTGIVVFTIEHERNSDNAQSLWAALDCKTGQTRWELPRNTSDKTSYSTPCLYQPVGGRPQLIFTSLAHGISAVDPSSGKVVWEAGSALISRVVSSPVIADDLIIAACGDAGAGKRLIAVKPNPDAPQPTEVYKFDESAMPYVPTSLAKDSLLFTFHDRGEVSCLRSATGELLWRQKPTGRIYGSPVWVDGKLYCINLAGDVVVVKASDKYELLAINPLGEKSSATPAVGAGRMLLRTYSKLFCIAAR
jgi:outer membrane protein assembly factor BamB